MHGEKKEQNAKPLNSFWRGYEQIGLWEKYICSDCCERILLTNVVRHCSLVPFVTTQIASFPKIIYLFNQIRSKVTGSENNEQCQNNVISMSWNDQASWHCHLHTVTVISPSKKKVRYFVDPGTTFLSENSSQPLNLTLPIT